MLKFIKTTIISLLIIILNIASVLAVDSLDYLVRTDKCDLDRICSFDICATGKSNLAAVIFYFSYDPNYMEFRSISSNSSFKMEHKEESNKVTSIILCDYGYNIKESAKLETLKFKIIKNGKTSVNLGVYDPVDGNANSIEIGNVYGLSLNIDGDDIKTEKVKSGKVTNSSGGIDVDTDSVDTQDVEDSDDLFSYNSDSKSKEPNATTTEGSKDDTYVLKENNSLIPYLIGGIVVVTVVLVCAIAYKLGKNQNENEKDKDNENTE